MTAEQLAKQLLSGEPGPQSAAAQTLASMGEAAAPAAVALARFSEDDDLGAACVAALEELGPPLASDAPPLVELLTTGGETTAYWAATLLGRLGSEAADAVGALEQAAGGDAPLAVRERAVWAIGKIGPAAHSAAPTLERLVGSDSARLARLAKKALAAITPE